MKPMKPESMVCSKIYPALGFMKPESIREFMMKSIQFYNIIMISLHLGQDLALSPTASELH